MPQFRPEFLAKVEETISHYPVSKRSASLPLLHLWQEEFGHVSDEGIHWIAEKLALQPIHILELVTFYPMFHQKPFGKYHIKVCRTLSCALGGGYELYENFKKATLVEGDAHGPISSSDGKYTIEFVECLASCGTAPVCMINDDFYENIDSSEKVESLLAKYNN